MRALIVGALLGLMLGTLYGPRMLRWTRDRSIRVPTKTETWITGALLLFAIRGVFRLPEGLTPGPHWVMLAYGFACVVSLLPQMGKEEGRLPLTIQLMHVFAGVLVLMVVARGAFLLSIRWLAESYR